MYLREYFTDTQYIIICRSGHPIFLKTPFNNCIHTYYGSYIFYLLAGVFFIKLKFVSNNINDNNNNNYNNNVKITIICFDV